MGRYATSLLLRRSPDGATRLAVTGMPAGMATREPLPATSLTVANACGGGWGGVVGGGGRAPVTPPALMAGGGPTDLVPAGLSPGQRRRWAAAAGAAAGNT